MTTRQTVDEPERRCILCGVSGSTGPMIRFAFAPDGEVTPDLAESLPGRGVWVCADRAALEEAIAKKRLIGALARSRKAAVRPDQVPDDLPARIDRLLAARVAGRLGLERKAGRLITGYEKVLAHLVSGRTALLIEAVDGAEDGRRKLRAKAQEDVIVAAVLDRNEMGLALGRENVVHAAVERGGGADRLVREMKRLAAWRGQPLGPQAKSGRNDGLLAHA